MAWTNVLIYGCAGEHGAQVDRSAHEPLPGAVQGQASPSSVPLCPAPEGSQLPHAEAGAILNSSPSASAAPRVSFLSLFLFAHFCEAQQTHLTTPFHTRAHPRHVAIRLGSTSTRPCLPRFHGGAAATGQSAQGGEQSPCSSSLRLPCRLPSGSLLWLPVSLKAPSAYCSGVWGPGLWKEVWERRGPRTDQRLFTGRQTRAHTLPFPTRGDIGHGPGTRRPLDYEL